MFLWRFLISKERFSSCLSYWKSYENGWLVWLWKTPANEEKVEYGKGQTSEKTHTCGWMESRDKTIDEDFAVGSSLNYRKKSLRRWRKRAENVLC